jgi:uncharacterized sulfatase
LFSGDNFYKTGPNLDTIRGAAYRNVRLWSITVEPMLQEKPTRLIGGHTRPIAGEQEIATTLTLSHRDALRFVFEKTIEDLNKGMTSDQLVEYLRFRVCKVTRTRSEPRFAAIQMRERGVGSKLHISWLFKLVRWQLHKFIHFKR